MIYMYKYVTEIREITNKYKLNCVISKKRRKTNEYNETMKTGTSFLHALVKKLFM